MSSSADSPRALAGWHPTPADTDRMPAPVGVALCWQCGTTADRVDPPGWVTATTATDRAVDYTFGVCGRCLADHFTLVPDAA